MGEIAIDQTDPERCTFTIQVLNRPYYLLAEDRAKCVDWVIQLNRAREARMNVGNIALADKPAAGGGGGGATSPAASHHRSQAGSDEYQPTIVYNTLRPRTRAVVYDGAENNGEGGGVPDLLRPAGSVEEQIEVLPGWSEHHRHSPASDAVARHPSPSSAADASMAKWQKRHSRMHLLSLRFLRWARSITNQADACRREQGVVVVPAHVARAYLAAAAGGSAETFEGADPGGGMVTGEPAGGTDAGGTAPEGGPPAVEVAGQQVPAAGAAPVPPGKADAAVPPSVVPGPVGRQLQQQTPQQPGPALPASRSRAGTGEISNRSRASTDSPAFGSHYV